MMGGTSDAMTFFQRLSNTFSFVMTNLMIGTVYTDIDTVIRQRLPELPPVMVRNKWNYYIQWTPPFQDILSSNSLVFLNSEPLVDFPKPSSARVIDIGGITVAEEGHKPLNQVSSKLHLWMNMVVSDMVIHSRSPSEYYSSLVWFDGQSIHYAWWVQNDDSRDIQEVPRCDIHLEIWGNHPTANIGIKWSSETGSQHLSGYSEPYRVYVGPTERYATWVIEHNC